MRIAFDAETPPATVPGGATTACIYVGGDTPNPIAHPAQVPAYAACRYWLPGWVRSNPTPGLGLTDAAAFRSWLTDNGAPHTCAVFLDLEEAVTPSYVNAFSGFFGAVLPYGSRSTVEKNPQCAGYFLAWPTWDGTTWPAGTVAIQHTYAGAYDLSSILTSVPLWGRGAQGEPLMSTAVTTTPTGKIVVAATGAGTRAGHQLLFVTEAANPGATPQVWDLTDALPGAGTAAAYTVE